MNNITNLIEGYSCYDLTILLETAVRIARSNNKNTLTTEDFERVCTEYKPASLKTVQLKVTGIIFPIEFCVVEFFFL